MHEPVARASAGLRLLRAATFAAACVVLSAAGHVLAAGRPLPPWTLGAGFALVLAVTAPLTGRARSLPGIAAGLALGQTGLHILFGLAEYTCGAPRAGHGARSERLVALASTLTCNGAGPPSPAEARRIVHAAGLDPAHYTGHGAAGHAAAHGSAHDMVGSALLPSLPMLLGHLIAAVLLGLLLRHGDAALLRLVRLSARSVAEETLVRALRTARLLHTLRAESSDAPAPLPRAPLGHFRNRTGPGSVDLDHGVARRGPPAYALAA